MVDYSKKELLQVTLNYYRQPTADLCAYEFLKTYINYFGDDVDDATRLPIRTIFYKTSVTCKNVHITQNMSKSTSVYVKVLSTVYPNPVISAIPPK